MSISAGDYWDRFVMYNDEYEDSRHSTVIFDGRPGAEDRVMALVLAKIKTATTSLCDCRAADGKPLPEEGDCSILVSSDGKPECITAVRNVTVLPFSEVGDDIAEKEGEGDQSLSYWRRTHEKRFRAECESRGLSFSPDMKVVCEEFEIVFQ